MSKKLFLGAVLFAAHSAYSMNSALYMGEVSKSFFDAHISANKTVKIQLQLFLKDALKTKSILLTQYIFISHNISLIISQLQESWRLYLLSYTPKNAKEASNAELEKKLLLALEALIIKN